MKVRSQTAKRWCLPAAAAAAIAAGSLRAGDAEATAGRARFLGSMGCSSSLCHGGGGGGRDAYTIWKRSDVHRRAVATLAGTRAARIAQGLQLASAANSVRCTVCHAPLSTVPEERLPAGLDARMENVSCESCHGPASNWVRSHTRLDFTHAQNVQTGVRDLRDLYVRANNCVACHQVLEPELLRAGHPPLVFELDAQTVAEPRHWLDKGDYFGPQAWLTGQAAALREMSWSISRSAETAPEVREQWRALVWLLQHTLDVWGDNRGLPRFDVIPGATDFTPGNVARAQATADDLARAAARWEWSRADARRCLDGLTGLDKEFVPVTGGESTVAMQARAQRLALALARLVAPFQQRDMAAWASASRELDKLFALADARVAFDGGAFAEGLKRFRGELGKGE